MDPAIKSPTHQFHKMDVFFLFFISKCLASNAEKTTQLKIAKKD